MSTDTLQNDRLWKEHLGIQSTLYTIGMQVLADKTLSNPDPTGPLNRFNRLWQRYAESAEHLKGMPPPSDAYVLERLQKGAASLMQIMASLREEAAAHMHQTRSALAQVRSARWVGSRQEQESRLFRTQV